MADPKRLKQNNSYEASLNGSPLKQLMTALASWPTGFAPPNAMVDGLASSQSANKLTYSMWL
jgi:hypothetical protein